MKAELRALERKFVKERATVMVHEFIDKLAYRWPQVLQGERTDTTVLDLVIELWDGDIPLPTITVTINYLERCLWDGPRKHRPERGRPLLQDGPLVRPPRQMTPVGTQRGGVLSLLPSREKARMRGHRAALLSLLPSREKARMRGHRAGSCPFSPRGRRLG